MQRKLLRNLEVKTHHPKNQGQAQPILEQCIAEMKRGSPLSEYLKQYREVTKTTSEIVRTLSLTGVVVVWTFRNSTENQKLFADLLIKALLFIIISVTLDLMQYIFMSISLKLFHKKNEIKLQNNEIKSEEADELEYPRTLSAIPTIIFYLKILSMFIGYFFIYKYIIQLA